MSEDLAKSIVQAASIMEQTPKKMVVVTLYQNVRQEFLLFRGFDVGKDLFRGSDVGTDFWDAYNAVIKMGYIPLDNDHPATQMMLRVETREHSYKFIGAFLKSE